MALALRYAKASVLYLAAGSTLILLTFAGLLAVFDQRILFHALYGFVAMMIFGVSYLFIPAFSHKTLYSLTLAQWQFWLFNIGTIGLVIGFSGLIDGDLVRVIQTNQSWSRSSHLSSCLQYLEDSLWLERLTR
jgi:heme/copper-type cytochrome/quinol oxidase subunit 1